MTDNLVHVKWGSTFSSIAPLYKANTILFILDKNHTRTKKFNYFLTQKFLDSIISNISTLP